MRWLFVSRGICDGRMTKFAVCGLSSLAFGLLQLIVTETQKPVALRIVTKLSTNAVHRMRWRPPVLYIFVEPEVGSVQILYGVVRVCFKTLRSLS